MMQSAVSEYRKQINQGFGWLMFRPELEREFTGFRQQRMAWRVRVILWICLVYVVLFTLADYFLFGLGFSSEWVPIRNTVSEMLIVLLLVSTYRGLLNKYQIWLGVVLSLHMVLLFTVWDGNSGMEPANMIMYVSSSYFVYFCFVLRFWPAVFVSYALFVGVCINVMVQMPSVEEMVYPILLIAFPNLIGPVVLYGLEFNKRMSFLLEKDMEYMSRHDQLTGLLDRKAIFDELQKVISHCYRERIVLSIAVIDIDYFKDFNDFYGHVQADNCLRKIAALVNDAGSRPLDFAGRFGGEEFVVVLPGCEHKQAVRVMQQLKKAVHELAIPHAGSRISDILTVSIGIIDVFPHRDHLSTRNLIQLADEAMLEAKAKGRDRIVSCSRESDLLARLSASSIQQARFQLA